MDTRNRLKQVALELFRTGGFAGTSIGAIESAAGLVPRAGAFYRYFGSKRDLLEELALSIAETPEEFDFEALKLYGNTRAELVAIAQAYMRAAHRQVPFARLIEEYRRLEGAQQFEKELNQDMLDGLVSWIATKNLTTGLSRRELVSVAMTVFGSWLFLLGKLGQGIEFSDLSKEAYLAHWADYWASELDRPGRESSSK